MENIVGFLSIGVIVLINVILTAYKTGQQTNETKNQGKRLDRIEKTLNGLLSKKVD